MIDILTLHILATLAVFCCPQSTGNYLFASSTAVLSSYSIVGSRVLFVEVDFKQCDSHPKPRNEAVG